MKFHSKKNQALTLSYTDTVLLDRLPKNCVRLLLLDQFFFQNEG